MTANNYEDIAKELKVLYKSSPLEIPNMLTGRESDFNKVVSKLKQPCLHLFIEGDNGIGKSSFLNYMNEKINKDWEKRILVRCEKKYTFLDVLRETFRVTKNIYQKSDIDIVLEKLTKKMKGVFRIFVINKEDDFDALLKKSDLEVLKENLIKTNALLLIDNFDLLDYDVRCEIKYFIHFLNENNSPFKIVAFTGIGGFENFLKIDDTFFKETHFVQKYELKGLGSNDIVAHCRKGNNRVYNFISQNAMYHIAEISAGNIRRVNFIINRVIDEFVKIRDVVSINQMNSILKHLADENSDALNLVFEKMQIDKAEYQLLYIISTCKYIQENQPFIRRFSEEDVFVRSKQLNFNNISQVEISDFLKKMSNRYYCDKRLFLTIDENSYVFENPLMPYYLVNILAVK